MANVCSAGIWKHVIIFFCCCNVTNNFWKQVLEWINFRHSPQEWKFELDWIIGHVRGKSKIARMLKICIVELIYHVWIIRNNRVFQPNSMELLNLQDVKERVKCRIQHDMELNDFVNNI